MILIVCGVSGTGKSTLGKLLADSLSLPFYDADDYHPELNVQKMKNGLALDDEDRQPWLEALANKLCLWENEDGAVLACSALKESYRQILKSKCKTNICWIILVGSKALLMERLGARKDHFFNPRLLDSQLEAFELPDYGLIVDVQPSQGQLVSDIVEQIN